MPLRSHHPLRIVVPLGSCLGHDSRIAGGVLVVSVVNGELKEVCSAKVRTLGQKVGYQAWRLHVHPQDSWKAAYVNRKGEVKWSLQEIEVPTVEQCVKEDALEVQDIRELGLGWAWFMNDLRAFLPAWQEMELASPSSEEPVTQIEADVPIEPMTSAGRCHAPRFGPTRLRAPLGCHSVWHSRSCSGLAGYPCNACFCRRPLSRQVDPYRSRCAYLSGPWQKWSCERTSGSSCHSRLTHPNCLGRLAL